MHNPLEPQLVIRVNTLPFFLASPCMYLAPLKGFTVQPKKKTITNFGRFNLGSRWIQSLFAVFYFNEFFALNFATMNRFVRRVRCHQGVCNAWHLGCSIVPPPLIFSAPNHTPHPWFDPPESVRYFRKHVCMFCHTEFIVNFQFCSTSCTDTNAHRLT